MKIWLCLMLVIIGISAQDFNSDDSDDHSHMNQPQMQQVINQIGGIISGELDPVNTQTNLHNIRIRNLEKKYLFIRVNTETSVPVNIGFYSNTTRKLIHSCFSSTFDSCYVPKEKINPNEVYVVLVAGKTKFRYLLYTYWGDIEHLNPGQQIKFSFEKANPTQLFHLDLDKGEDFKQIRLVLRPQTARDPNDQLKIFATKGFDSTPSQEKYDYKSVHVWGDSQAIFITKQQLSGEKGLNIFITGSSSTIYLFKCQLITGEHHQLSINETIYEYIEEGQSLLYQIDFSTDRTVDYFAVKGALFSGEIYIGFYEDKQMNKKYRNKPMQYMSDVEFVFQKGQFPDDILYMQVSCPDSSAIYQLSVQGRLKGKSFEINQNIYEFLPVKSREGFFFYHHQMKNEVETFVENSLVFQVSTIHVEGDMNLDFYVCKVQYESQDCKDFSEANLKETAEHLKAERQQVGTKKIFRFEVNRSFLKPINSMEDRLMVIGVVREQKPSTNGGLIAIEFANPNKIRFLREERAFEDRVMMQETKYYKYVNNDPNIFNIKLFISEISGLTNIAVQRTDFREKSNSDTLIKPSPQDKSYYTISENLTEPIYISVTGLVTSIYALSISATHKDHPINSAITLAEDLEYEFKILPYQFVNIEIHPIQTEVTFEYSTEGGSIAICALDQKGLCDKNTSMEVGSKGKFQIDSSDFRYKRYRLGNYVNGSYNSHPENGEAPFDDSAPKAIVKTNKVKVIYHSTQDKHCESRKINHIYSEVAETGKCYKFHLPLVADIQIFQARQDIGPSFSMYFICDAKITPSFSNERLKVNGSEISQKCKDTPNDMYIIMVVADISAQLHHDIRMDFSVEYKNDTITLADGVGYHTAGRSIEGPMRTFFYEILDSTLPTQINLLNSKGVQKFFIDIAPDNSKKYNAVVQSRALLTSKDSKFYSNPSITVNTEIIDAQPCHPNCVIVISVYSTQKVGSQVEYTIEATQREIVLREDDIRRDFLPKGSFNYYKYEVRKDKAQLMIKASDNGRSCERIFLSLAPYPSPSNYFVQQNSGVLINPNTKKGMYYIGVQAIEDCQYHISISENKGSLTKLSYGQFYDLQLKEGEGKWFYTHHAANSNFKILSLLKSGGIQIYANQTALQRQDINNLLQGNLDYEKFKFKTGYKNSLIISKDFDGFCSDCHYVIYVKAIKFTKTTIYMGDQNSKISLEKGKVYYDEFDHLDTTSMATFYQVSSGTALVKVHSGSIKFELTYHDQKFEKDYQTSKQVYRDPYNFTKHEDNYDPITIKVTPLTIPTFYSYELVPETSIDDNTYKVNPGEHTYLFLTNGEQQCLTGFLNEKDDQIFITSDTDETLSLGQLKIKASLDGKDTDKYETDVIGNIISIGFVFDSIFFTEAVQYRLCLSIQDDQTLALMAFQNAKVNLVHSNTEVLIRDQSTFVMYPRGDIILDVFQCRGDANISFADSESKLNDAKSNQLDVIGGASGQDHAIRIEEYSSLYVKVTGVESTMIWMPLNPEKEKGVGYFKYKIGQLSYESKFNKIDFHAGAVFQEKETNTSILQVRYSLYITKTKNVLQYAVNCEKIGDEHLLHYVSVFSHGGKSSRDKITFSINKKQITDKYSTNDTIYFNVVADMTLRPPGEKVEDQHYRFIYFPQQVPAEVFRQNQIQSLQIGLLILLALVSVGGVILVAFVFIRWIVPAIGVLKNRMLVEEKDDDRDKSIPVPPSSDRNQIDNNNLDNDMEAPETDERIK